MLSFQEETVEKVRSLLLFALRLSLWKKKKSTVDARQVEGWSFSVVELTVCLAKENAISLSRSKIDDEKIKWNERG